MASRGSSGRRPVFHAVVLAIGFIVGGAFTQIARKFLPPGAVKEVLTTGVTPSFGPITIDLVILKFALGPVALDVSLLSLVGVLIAFLILRSLF
jgi:large-conductance mechanosensitive channel